MKKITFNIDEQIYEKLGSDKTEINKAAKSIIENSFIEVPQLTPAKEESKLVSQIKGYLSEGDSVYMQVISNYHKRIQRNIKLEDL